jgi:hypothetical protein
MTDRDVLPSVLTQIEWWWSTIFRPRLEGLTDEEYLWEPVEGCWSLHPADDGSVTYDFDWPPPEPTPVTTIAWRLCHIGIGCLANRAGRLYPDAVPRLITANLWEGDQPFPITADGAITFLDEWWTIWIDALRGAGEAGLWEPLGQKDHPVPMMGLGEDDPTLNLVLHVHRELMHHGAEVCLLRDLYRARPVS